MNLFTGIFYDAEILQMSETFFKILAEVLDDRLALRVVQFWKQEPNTGLEKVDDRLREIRDMSKEVMREKVAKLTFSEEIKEMGIMRLFNMTGPSNLFNSSEDLDELYEKFTFLINNKERWSKYIEPRENEKWCLFLNACNDIEKSLDLVMMKFAVDNLVIERNPNLMKTIKDNSVAFYSHGEKRRSTRLDALYSRPSDLEQMLHGLEYYKILQKERVISVYDRRLF